MKWILAMAMTFPVLPAVAAGTTADSIIRTMTETMSPQQSRSVIRMTIETSTGQERTFVYETFSKGKGEDSKSLMKYLEPARVKGQSILMLNDANDIWTWFPRTKRVRKLATHAKKQKVEGSDFSYEDMGGGDAFIEEYDAKLAGEEKQDGRTCHRIELTAKPDGGAGYSRVLLWVDKERLVPLLIRYYHEKDPGLREKELACSDVQPVGDIFSPMKCVMHNVLDDTRTIIETEEIDIDVDLPDDMFTEMGMQQ